MPVREAHVWGHHRSHKEPRCIAPLGTPLPSAASVLPCHGQTPDCRQAAVHAWTDNPLQVLALPLAGLSVPPTRRSRIPPRTCHSPELGHSPLQPALPAPGDPPGASCTRGKLVWQQPGVCGLGSGQGRTPLFEGSPSLGQCHMAALVSTGGACAPRGDGCRTGVTSSLQELWSLGGSDRGAGVRAARGAALRPGAAGQPPGPCAGGAIPPTAPLRGSPSSASCEAAGLLVGRGATGRAVGLGMPETPALPRSSGCQPPCGWQPRRLLLWLMLKPGRHQYAWPCLPSSPSAWGRQLQQDCFSSQSRICLSPVAKKSHRLGLCGGTANLLGRAASWPPQHTSWFPHRFSGCPWGASPPSSPCWGQARQRLLGEMVAAALPRGCPSRRVQLP